MTAMDTWICTSEATWPSVPMLAATATLAMCKPVARRARTVAAPMLLYHNNGDGTFTNVSKAANILQPDGKNLAVGAADYDNDGWPDLFVANDGMAAVSLSESPQRKIPGDRGRAAGVAFTACAARPWRQCAFL